MRSAGLFFVVFALFFALVSAKCGTVYDGLRKGSDAKELSDEAFGVNWNGFHPEARIEIALVSEDVAAKISGRCTSEAIDADWTPVDGSISSHALPSRDGRHAFLVKATHPSGQVFIARSDGFAYQARRREQASLEARDPGCPCAPQPGLAQLPPLAERLPINYGASSVNGQAANGGQGGNNDGYSGITKAGIVIGTVVGSAVLFAAILFLIGMFMGSGGYGATVVAAAPASSGGVHHEFFPSSS